MTVTRASLANMDAVEEAALLDALNDAVIANLGPEQVFGGATGENSITIPANLADALSYIVNGVGDLIVIDTTTGAIVYTFSAAVRVNIAGSAQIGNATADLVGFHGATPTDQCAALVQTFSTADRTHAARTATAITDNSGGAAADGTIAAITLTEPANLAAQTVINAQLAAAIKELATGFNLLLADVADTAAFANSIADDLQEKGISG